MFTGIIEEIGIIVDIESISYGRNFLIKASHLCEDIHVDDSIAVDGVCLTVIKVLKENFKTTAIQETLNHSTLSLMTESIPVNLERALRPTDRMGGHMVQGHVDDIGTIHSFDKIGNGWILNLECPEHLLHYCVEKGSITINGISLTIAAIRKNLISTAIIPHTYSRTTLKYAKVGKPVNIEVDILAKYIDKMLINRSKYQSHDESWYHSHGF